VKHSKVAAAVAGSVMALGTAAPALAADGVGETAPMSLNGALNDTLASGNLGHLHATPGLSQGKGGGDPLKPVTRVAKGLTKGQSVQGKVVRTAAKAAPLLGGLPAGLR